MDWICLGFYVSKALGEAQPENVGNDGPYQYEDDNNWERGEYDF